MPAFGFFTPTPADVQLDVSEKNYDLGRMANARSVMGDLLGYLLAARQQASTEDMSSMYLGLLQRQAMYDWLDKYLTQQNAARANELAAQVARLQSAVQARGYDTLGSTAARFADSILALARGGLSTQPSQGSSTPVEFIPMVPRQIGRQWTLGVSPQVNRFVNFFGQTLAPQNNNVVENWGQANYLSGGLQSLYNAAAGRRYRNRLRDLATYAGLLNDVGSSTFGSLVNQLA